MKTTLCPSSDIAPGGMKAFKVEGRDVVICNYNGTFYGLDGRCSHQNALLDRGTLDGSILTCPLHFAQFDITTGEALSGPVPPDPLHPTRDLATYPVIVENETVKIKIG